MDKSYKHKIIIFDLDGVLFDTTEIVNSFFLTTYPTLTKDEANELLTGNFHVELEKMKQRHRTIEETPEEYKVRSERYSSDKSKSALYPGIGELLGKLHGRGYVLVINTSALERNCLPLLEYSKVATLFDFVATKEVAVSKTEKFEFIAKKYGVRASDMLFITDTLGDVREADIAGVPTIAVTYGAHDKSYFARESHENLIAIVNSVLELGKAIEIFYT